MIVKKFVEGLKSDFFAGVPDSQLRPLCDFLIQQYGTDPLHHVIAANEGNAAALAAGYHLATGKVPVVYMQNSGEGNVINPIASLLNKQVYGIPCIFVIGWRGEPGISDEPQHRFQGEVTLSLLDVMEIPYMLLDKHTTVTDIQSQMEQFQKELTQGSSVAFVVKKGALVNEENVAYQNDYQLTREEAIQVITEYTGEDPIISTTGKASRELYEARDTGDGEHKRDFLTVGSMGHSSSIALAVAAQKPTTRVWCLDGDGAVLMHMGAMGVVGHYQPENLVHIILNNQAHETVGGMPTVAESIDFPAAAKACGYPVTYSVADAETLRNVLAKIKSRRTLTMLEIKCSLGARADLGRPKTPAIENKEGFMQYLAQQE